VARLEGAAVGTVGRRAGVAATGKAAIGGGWRWSITLEWSGVGTASNIFGEGTLETQAILKFGLGRYSLLKTRTKCQPRKHDP
jgi:hypothetical protein